MSLAIKCFLKTFLQNQLSSLGTPVYSQRDFLGGNSKYSFNKSISHLLLFIIGLFAINIWCIQSAQTLRYLDVAM